MAKVENMRLWQKAVAFLDSCDSRIEEICAKISACVHGFKWLGAFQRSRYRRASTKNRGSDRIQPNPELKKKRVFEILHDRPKSFGVNRSNWTRENPSQDI